jgi:hypothetical protein
MTLPRSLPPTQDERVKTVVETMAPGSINGLVKSARPVTGQGQATAQTGDALSGDPVVIGKGASAGAAGAVAIGVDATVPGNFSTAVGASAQAYGDGSVALGGAAQGADTTSIGAGSNAEGAGSVVVGSQAHAVGVGAIAIGLLVNAGYDGSVAIGRDSAGTPAVVAANDDFVLGTPQHKVRIQGDLKTGKVGFNGATPLSPATAPPPATGSDAVTINALITILQSFGVIAP